MILFGLINIFVKFSAREQMKFIRSAMDKIEEISCIKFVKRDSRKHEDYIVISGEKEGCFSQLGRHGEIQLEIK